jgi:hypothetical protein
MRWNLQKIVFELKSQIIFPFEKKIEQFIDLKRQLMK